MIIKILNRALLVMILNVAFLFCGKKDSSNKQNKQKMNDQRNKMNNSNPGPTPQGPKEEKETDEKLSTHQPGTKSNTTEGNEDEEEPSHQSVSSRQPSEEGEKSTGLQFKIQKGQENAVKHPEGNEQYFIKISFLKNTNNGYDGFRLFKLWLVDSKGTKKDLQNVLLDTQNIKESKNLMMETEFEYSKTDPKTNNKKKKSAFVKFDVKSIGDNELIFGLREGDHKDNQDILSNMEEKDAQSKVLSFVEHPKKHVLYIKNEPTVELVKS